MIKGAVNTKAATESFHPAAARRLGRILDQQIILLLSSFEEQTVKLTRLPDLSRKEKKNTPPGTEMPDFTQFV